MIPETRVHTRKRRSPDLGLIVGSVMAACACLGSALLLWAWLDPAGPGEGAARLSFVEMARAEALLDQPAPSAAQVDAAEAAARRVLSQEPTLAEAWLYLAYIDSQRHGWRLTPAGVKDLQNAYDFEPFGPDISEGRVLFALNHWDQVTPEIRDQALAEFETRWSFTGRRPAIRKWSDDIVNPAGRIAAMLTVARLASEEPGPGEPRS